MSLFLWALSHRSTLGSRFWSDIHTLTFSHTLGSEYSTLHPLHLALKLGLKPGSHLVWKANKVTASFQNPHPTLSWPEVCYWTWSFDRPLNCSHPPSVSIHKAWTLELNELGDKAKQKLENQKKTLKTTKLSKEFGLFYCRVLEDTQIFTLNQVSPHNPMLHFQKRKGVSKLKVCCFRFFLT